MIQYLINAPYINCLPYIFFTNTIKNNYNEIKKMPNLFFVVYICLDECSSSILHQSTTQKALGLDCFHNLVLNQCVLYISLVL